MLLKFLLIVLLGAAMFYLFASLRYLLGSKEEDRLAFQKQLAKRFGLCILAFSLLMLAFFNGYIQPHNLT